jgi:cell wall-associated NlpC family hydrolase
LLFDVARNHIAAFAVSQIGTPYVFGSTGGGIDCSTLTRMSYDKAGVPLLKGKNAEGQYNFSLIIDDVDAKYGDLVFFKGTYDKVCDGYKEESDGVTHVAIFLRPNVMVSAQKVKGERGAGRVIMTEISSWRERYPQACFGTLTCDQFGKGVCTGEPGWVENNLAGTYDPFAGYGKILP